MATDHAASPAVAGSPGRARDSRWRILTRQYGLVKGTRALFFGSPRPKELRPSGHSAFIERLRTPMIVLTSLSMTVGATYVLAKQVAITFFTALFVTHNTAIAFESGVALAPIFITGLVLDYTFVTAAIRYTMHRVRGRADRVYVVAAICALVFTGLTETLTLAYLFYEVEPSSVTGVAVNFVRAVPSYLFWVRAGAALVCLFYQIGFVLPVRLTRRDFKHAQAAKASSIAMAFMEDLLRAEETEDLNAKVAGMDAALALFRDADEVSPEAEADAERRDGKLRLAMERFIDVRLGRDPYLQTRARVALDTATHTVDGSLSAAQDPRLLPGPVTRAKQSHDGGWDDDADPEWRALMEQERAEQEQQRAQSNGRARFYEQRAADVTTGGYSVSGPLPGAPAGDEIHNGVKRPGRPRFDTSMAVMDRTEPVRVKRSRDSRRDDSAARAAKADPAALTQAPRAQRWDADVPAAERAERVQRKVDTGIELLREHFVDEQGQPLRYNPNEDGWGTRPFARKIAEAIKAEFGDHSGCTPIIAKDAAREYDQNVWRPYVQAHGLGSAEPWRSRFDGLAAGITDEVDPEADDASERGATIVFSDDTVQDVEAGDY